MSTYHATGKYCVCCEYWHGPRRVTHTQEMNAVECESGATQGTCYGTGYKRGKRVNASDTVGGGCFKCWSVLKGAR